MYLNELPGYQRAIARADRLEDHWRDLAFLGLTETIRCGGGFSLEVRQLTLRMFIQLCAVRSPFMVGGRIGPEHVAQILWRLSPAYAPGDKTARSAFIASIAQLTFRTAVRAIGRYLDRMLMDKPPSSGGSDGSKSDTCFAAAFIHALGSAYGWSDDMILDSPMPRLFQYLRKIQQSQAAERGESLCTFNPLRDRFTKRITDKALNQKCP